MRKIFFVLMICLGMAWAQTTTFTLPLRSKTTGKLVPGKTVALYQSGVKKYDLTEMSPGVYTNSSVGTGKYDVYVNGSPLTGWQGVWHGDDTLTKLQGNTDGNGVLQSSGIADGAILHSKLGTQVIDSTDFSTSAKEYIQNNGGTERDTTVTYSSDFDSLAINISNWLFTSPRVTNMIYYSGYFGASIKSISANYLIIKTNISGYGSNVKLTIGVSE